MHHTRAREKRAEDVASRSYSASPLIALPAVYRPFLAVCPCPRLTVDGLQWDLAQQTLPHPPSRLVGLVPPLARCVCDCCLLRCACAALFVFYLLFVWLWFLVLSLVQAGGGGLILLK